MPRRIQGKAHLQKKLQQRVTGGGEAPPKRPPDTKSVLHPRNRHRERYDFPALIASHPALGPFVAVNSHGDASVDFADPRAVLALNTALLAHHYGIAGWRLPAQFLCPPIPGRADYLHHLADLLAGSGGIPRGPAVRILDIGVGANCIYPLIGQREYAWSFLGSDANPEALAAAAQILRANPGMEQSVELRFQSRFDRIFSGVVREGERFAACLCNPPFHGSLEEAREGTLRKLRNLDLITGKDSGSAPPLNFGGQAAELWCPGGEGAFIGRMIGESAHLPGLCRWFTSLVAKEASLPGLQTALDAVRPKSVRIIPMAQGQKRSRILAWSFQELE